VLVELVASRLVELDLRYATADNIAGRAIYFRPVALLRPEALAALALAADRAGAMGLRLRVYDAYRPIEAQQVLWDTIPDKRYVADPRQGGLHSRGVAVDLTLVDSGTGLELPMGTGFDAMTPLSAHDATAIPAAAMRNRALLLGLMTAAGWSAYPLEWWHYHLPTYLDFPPVARTDAPNGPM